MTLRLEERVRAFETMADDILSLSVDDVFDYGNALGYTNQEIKEYIQERIEKLLED